MDHHPPENPPVYQSGIGDAKIALDLVAHGSRSSIGFSAAQPDSARRLRRWTPRARTGCKTCRRRRVKCDEAQPVCGQCTATRRFCDYNALSPKVSTGCMTCRRRRVKCDEAQPVCGQCTATRRVCGYDALWTVNDWLLSMVSPWEAQRLGIQRTTNESPPVFESQYPLEDIPLGHRTSNRRQAGRIYYAGNEGQLSEADRDTLASNHNWVDEPMHLPIRSGEASLPASSAEAMRQYERMCSRTRNSHASRRDEPLPPWLQSLDRVSLELDIVQVSRQNQPRVAQDTIARYPRMNADLPSVASAAATWGTYRPGDGDETRRREASASKLEEAGLAEARGTGRDRFREEIREVVSGTVRRGDQQDNPEPESLESGCHGGEASQEVKDGIDTQDLPLGKDAISTSVVGRTARFEPEDMPHDFDRDMFFSADTPTGAQMDEDMIPMEEDHRTLWGELESVENPARDYGLIDEIEPTITGFRQHVLSLNPLMDADPNNPVEREISHLGYTVGPGQALEPGLQAESPKSESFSDPFFGVSFGDLATVPNFLGASFEPTDEEAPAEAPMFTQPTSPTNVQDHILSAIRSGQEPSTLRHPTAAGTVLQTDSGYASLRKTIAEERKVTTEPQGADADPATDVPHFDDAATEYTDASSIGTWKRESYILDFAEDLFEKILDLHPDLDDVERISGLLPDLLKAFALRLGSQAKMPVYRDMMYFVCKYRRVIANAFKNRRRREEEHPERDEAEVAAFQDEKMPLNDLMASWFEGQGHGQTRPQETEGNDIAHSPARSAAFDGEETKSRASAKSEEVAEDNNASIMGYRALVLETDAFRWLLARLRLEMRLVPTEPRAMETIRKKIMSSLRSPGPISRKTPPKDLTVTFELDWDVRDFFEQQKYDLKPSEALPRVTTLTGSEKDAQALTCAEYLAQTWPLTGTDVLGLMRDVVDGEDNAPQSSQLSDGTRVSAWTEGPEFRAEAHGTASSLAEIGEQIAWLAAALRLSPFERGIACCCPFISEIRMASLWIQESSRAPVATTYKFGFQVDSADKTADGSSGQCWHDIFMNPVVVKGYPVPSRDEAGTGMEVPLNILAGLARTDQLDEFGGATFIKGFSTLLIPVKRTKDSIVWHLAYNADGSRISYLRKILSLAGHVGTLELGSTRHILGWCTDAEFLAGSAQADYLVGASGLAKPREDGALAGLFVSPGRGIVGGAAFVLGLKDTPAHVNRHGYIPRLQWLSTKFILLWDESDQRGWLINGTSALLHMVRASLAHSGTDKFKAAYMFKPRDMEESETPGTADAAIDVLINPKNLALRLYPEKDGYLLLQSRIDRYYNILEKLIDHQADITGEDGSKLADHPRRYLEGWDFRDLAISRDPLYPRATTLSAEGKGWVDLTRVLHAVTLFGRGFGELIRPGPGACDLWAELPKGAHMAYSDSHVRVVPMPWDSAERPLRAGQTLLPSSMLNVLLPRRLLIPEESSGAVIFGRHSDFPWMWRDHGAPQEECSTTSSKLSSTSSIVDSGIGTSIPSKLESATATPRSGTPRNHLAGSHGTGAASSEAASAHDTYAEDYTVGILCALPKELLAVRALFDRKHGGLEHIAGDNNHYSLGEIGSHMVVAVCLPKGDYGTNPAADSASNLRWSFPNIKFCLLVGIGGGIPSKQHDIRLGDVVVSAPTGNYPGVIQYDRGKDNENRNFERTGSLPPPPRFLMTAISRLEGDPDRPSNPLEPHLARIQNRIQFPKRLEYMHPGQEHDTSSQAECQTCQSEGKCFERNAFLRKRSRRPTDDPEIFYGLIASGNRVIKNAHVRNEWAEKCGVLCFEMEAAGIMNTLPCLVIRGICDYADSSKNKIWQEYAAATAAAFAKLLLEESGTYGASVGKSLSFGKRARRLSEDESSRKQQRI